MGGLGTLHCRCNVTLNSYTVQTLYGIRRRAPRDSRTGQLLLPWALLRARVLTVLLTTRRRINLEGGCSHAALQRPAPLRGQQQVARPYTVHLGTTALPGTAVD